MANAGKRLYIQPVTRQSPNPACRQSEAGTERETEGVSYPLSSLPLLKPPHTTSLHISTTQGPVKPLPTHLSPQLKVVLHQWLRFLHSILRKGQNRQRVSCKAATNKRHSLYYTTCRLQHTVYGKWLPAILPSRHMFTVGQQWYRNVTIPLKIHLGFDAGR